MNQLTASEATVFVLYCRGYALKEIAAAVDRSQKTIEKHLQSAFKSLNLHCRAQAIHWAILNKIIDAGDCVGLKTFSLSSPDFSI